MRAAEKVCQEKQAALDEFPTMKGTYGRAKCPHCDEEVAVRHWEERGQTEIALKFRFALELPTEDNAHDSKQKRNAAKAALVDAENVFNSLKQQLDEINAQIETAASAQASLEEAEGRDDNTNDLSEAREALEDARQDVARLSRYTRATKLHGMIVVNQTVIELLKPEGVRMTVLARALKSFNDKFIAPVIDSTSKDPAKRWPAVEIRPDFQVTWGGFVYGLASASQQWRVRAVLAIAMAKANKQHCIILDGADILPAASRGQLFNALIASGIPSVVVGMTETREDRLPPLAEKGLGRVYWLETEGQCREVTNAEG